MKSEVFLTDNREYLNSIPDGSFDWAVDDPPYFSGPERRNFYGQARSQIGVKRVEYVKMDKWSPPGRDYFDLLRAKTKNQIVWGENYFDHGMGPGRLVWDKVNQKSDYSDVEIAAISTITSTRIYRFMWNGMLQGEGLWTGERMQGNKKKNEKRIHQTQKPVQLYIWQLMTFCTKAGLPVPTIIDPHTGSGSSRIACDILGLPYVGLEVNPTNFRNQEERWKLYLEEKERRSAQFQINFK